MTSLCGFPKTQIQKVTSGKENRGKTDLIRSSGSALTQEVVITSEHSRHTRREDLFCTNGSGQGGRREREGDPHMTDQIKRHAERKPPQTQLLAVMRMGGFLEVLRIGFVREAPVEPGRPPAYAPPGPQCVVRIKHDRVELHAAHQELDRVAHDRVLGRETRRDVDGDRAPGWAAGGEVRERGPVEGCLRGRVDGLLVRHKLEEDNRGEDHEEPLAQRSGNFSVVELAYAEEVFLGKVETNFLPSLAHGCRSNYPLVNRTNW